MANYYILVYKAEILTGVLQTVQDQSKPLNHLFLLWWFNYCHQCRHAVSLGTGGCTSTSLQFIAALTEEKKLMLYFLDQMPPDLKIYERLQTSKGCSYNNLRQVGGAGHRVSKRY